MPATLPIPAQVQAQPVTSFYRGKALRADTALREKQAEALQMEIEGAPAAAAAAGRAEQLKINEDRRKQAEADREAAEAMALSVATDLSSWLDVADTKSDEDASSYLAGKMQERFSAMEDGPEKDKLSAILENGVSVDERLWMRSFTNKALGIDTAGGKADYTLGDTRYSGATNQPLATNPKDNDSERERRIQDYMAEFGLTREEAIKRDSKLLTVSQPDSRGNVTITDLSTSPPTPYQRNVRGEGPPSDEGGGELGEGSPDQPWDTPAGRVNISGNLDSSVIAKAQGGMLQQDISLMAALEVSNPDFEEGVGAASILQRGVNSVLQATSFNTLPRIFAEETAAADQLRKFNQSVRASLTTSDRGAVWDLQMVEKLLPDPDSIFKDPEGEAIKFTQTVQAVSQKREDNVAALNGRKPKLIERKRLGTLNDPLLAASMEEAEALAADPLNIGSIVMVGGVPYPIIADEE